MLRSSLTNVALLALTACVADQAPEPAASTASDLEVLSVFEKGTLWTKDDLVVCWTDGAMAPKYAAGRATTQDAIESSWGAVSRIHFLGWGPCTTTHDPDIVIEADDAGSMSQFGNHSKGVFPSMHLNLNCEFAPSECSPGLSPTTGQPIGPGALCKGKLAVTGGEATPLDKKKCVEGTAMHEFGHALGLRHEQTHPDSTCSDPESLNTDGLDGQPLWSYDADSIMNYCNRAGIFNGPGLSTGDIRGITTLYPSGVIRFNGPHFTLGTSVYGPGIYTLENDDWVGDISSLVISPGLAAELCAGNSCITYKFAVPTLPAALDHHATKLTIYPLVIATDNPGYLTGPSQVFSEGQSYLANANGLNGVGNDRISALFVPPGLSVALCNHEGSGEGQLPCGWFPGGPEAVNPPYVQLPAALDNNASFLNVTAGVVVYDDSNFRGTGHTFGMITWRASQGGLWGSFGHTTRSILIPPSLQVVACEYEDGRGCQTLLNSIADTSTNYRYFDIQPRPPTLRHPPNGTNSN